MWPVIFQMSHQEMWECFKMKSGLLPFMLIFFPIQHGAAEKNKKVPPHIIVIVIDDLGNKTHQPPTSDFLLIIVFPYRMEWRALEQPRLPGTTSRPARAVGGDHISYIYMMIYIHFSHTGVPKNFTVRNVHFKGFWVNLRQKHVKYSHIGLSIGGENVT